MAVDDVRVHLRPLLERDYGVEGAAYLMDRPPDGWGDLVTNRTLERELDTLRHELRVDITELGAELRGEMAGLRAELRDEMAELRIGLYDGMQAQTKWIATFVFAAQGVVVAAIAAVGAVLRFA